MNLLILDNYDSFTYNLVHLVRQMSCEPVVARNDKITLEQVNSFDKILLSPGPGVPSQAGIMLELIKTYASTKSILGVCLGHQGIGEAFGAELYNLPKVYHGIVTTTYLEKGANSKLLEGVPETFDTCRYHSWVVKPDTLPTDLVITATNGQDTIMGLKHRNYDVEGLQFHPESFLTQHGNVIIKNWLEN